MRSLIGSIVDRAPVPYSPRRAASLRRSGLFGRSRGDRTAQLEAFDSLGVLFGIVDRTSTSTAAVGWKLWRKAASGRDEDRVEVPRHAALDVWNRPSTLTVEGGHVIAVATQREFVEASQQHMDLVGEMWWLVARSPLMRSLPLELWTVRPDRIQPVPHPEKYLLGYVYTSPDGEEIPLELDEVIPTKRPHPTDPYRGAGVVQSLLTTLDSVRYSEEWNRNFFINSAEPGGIIEIDKRLGEDEWNEFRERWAEQHRGVAAAHRVALIEHGAKWVDRKFSMRDMQFAELNGVGDAKIRQAFGMPKFALGDVDDVNRATADASNVWFSEQLTIPRLDRIRDTLNFRFLPLFGNTTKGLEFDYEDPVPADAEARDRERTSKASAAKTYIEAGFTGDSVVEALELPDALVWEKPQPKPAPVAPGQPAGDPAPGDTTPAALAGPTLRALLVDQADDEPEEDWQTALAALLATWQADITPAQRDELHEQIVAVVNAGDRAALATLTVTTAAGAVLLADAMTGQATAAIQRMLDEAVAQGQTAPPPTTVQPDEEALAATAAATAALLGAGLAAAAGREALRVWGPDSTGRQVADAVDAHLAGLSDVGLRDQLGGGIWHAEGHGRMRALAELPAIAYLEASERRDRNTCDPCSDVDGRRYATVAAAQADYPTLAGYVDCQGGIRCRGTVNPHW